VTRLLFRQTPVVDRTAAGLNGLSAVTATARGGCTAGLSAARMALGRELGAARSPPSGGGLDPATAACPFFEKPHDQLWNDAIPDEDECSQILLRLPIATVPSTTTVDGECGTSVAKR